LEPGRVVFSKAGRDKGKPFVVMSQEGEYAYLADGDLRPVNTPKRKKLKHIQPTNTVIEDIQIKILNGKHLMDSDIKKALLPFKSKHKEDSIV